MRNKIAFDIYKKHYIQTMLLEVLVLSPDGLDNQEMKQAILRATREVTNISNNVTMSYVTEMTDYLLALSLIKVENSKIFISDIGIETLRNGSLPSISSSSYFSYKGLIASNWALLISFIALIISIIALVIT
jgi:hypothetical protein